jgi:hypothetical protein
MAATSSVEISIGVDSKQVKTGLDALQDQFRQARGRNSPGRLTRRKPPPLV